MMNREIKFRMWSDYDKKMIHWNELLGKNLANIFTIPSYNKWLMQYTGLHDKNGKEIYEGDIIRIKNSLIEIEGEVIFDTIDLSFEVYDKENDCKEMLLYVNEEFEVIGNVFEKGILLNDGKKSKKN